MSHSIELDVAWDCPTSLLTEWEVEYSVKFILLQENGPAGGNPLYLVTGAKEDLERLVRAHFHGGQPGDDHADYLITHIEEA